MESIQILIMPVLMLSSFYLAFCSNRLRLAGYSKYVVSESNEVDPYCSSDININNWFNIKNLTFVLLAALFLFWVRYRFDNLYIFKLIYGGLLIISLRANALHICNIFIFKFVRNNPDEIKGQIIQSGKYIYALSAGKEFAFTIAIIPLAILSGSFYLYGAVYGGVLMTVSNIGRYRKFQKRKETSSSSATSGSKSGVILKKLKPCFWIALIAILVASEGHQIYLNRTYPKEDIETLFSPITSKYGIKIVHEIGEDFYSPLKNPSIQAGPTRNSKVTPIRHRVLLRYPDFLKRALEKYPIDVIKNYLNVIQFVGKIEDGDSSGYWGTYDPFRRIIYLVDNGEKNEDQAMGTFHHEFSSLLLKSHSFWINLWTDHHPENFKYYEDIYDTWNEVIEAARAFKDVDCYKKGIVANYGLTGFENDFNEYSEMIFAYPQKFKQIMEQYPRVRGKFLVWLDFYQKVDPIFTEEYFFGKSSYKESYDKGVEYAIQGKFKEAKKEFEKALKADEYNKTAAAILKTIKDVIAQKTEREAAIHLFKGISFVDKVQHDQAVEEFTKAIEISPRFVEAYLNRGISYDICVQYDQAVKEFTKAIEICPKCAEAYNARGFTYRKMDQYDLAIKDYTKSIEINPTDVTTYINRGLVFDEKGRLDQALKDYIKAIEINPICKTMVVDILLTRSENRL